MIKDGIATNDSTVSNHKKFAGEWGFTQVFIFFLIGCIVGTYYEEILNYVVNGVWESRRGIIYGPFNPVYGIGLATFIILLGKNSKQRSWVKTWMFSALIGGGTEFLLSLLGETLFNSTSWDYSHHFLNIFGRTTIPFMIVWGLAGLLLMRYVYPFICRLLTRIPVKMGKRIVPILVVLISLDMFVSYTALIRQGLRKQGIPPSTELGKLYDKIYTDEFLYTVYPNMEHNE